MNWKNIKGKETQIAIILLMAFLGWPLSAGFSYGAVSILLELFDPPTFLIRVFQLIFSVIGFIMLRKSRYKANAEILFESQESPFSLLARKTYISAFSAIFGLGLFVYGITSIIITLMFSLGAIYTSQ